MNEQATKETEMNLRLKVEVTRKVSEQELSDMIWGTGALSYPWWHSVTRREDGMFAIRHDGEDSEEGAYDKCTVVSPADVVWCAGKYLTERALAGAFDGDHRDALNENLGYLDAVAADTVLQYAVFGGETVFS